MGIYPITTLHFSCKPLHFHSSVTIISKSVHATISILKTQAMASCSNLWSLCLKHENQTQHIWVLTMGGKQAKNFLSLRMKPNANHVLWMTVMNQSRFINCKRRSALQGKLIMVEAGYMWAAGEHEQSPYCPFSFAVNLRLLQKYVVLIKERNKTIHMLSLSSIHSANILWVPTRTTRWLWVSTMGPSYLPGAYRRLWPRATGTVLGHLSRDQSYQTRRIQLFYCIYHKVKICSKTNPLGCFYNNRPNCPHERLELIPDQRWCIMR